MRTIRYTFLSFMAVLVLALPFAAAAQTALQFIAVTPCRVIDTRNTGGPIDGGQSRDFVIPGTCGIPSNAAAFSLNVAVVPHGYLGYLTIWPAGQTRPLIATLNSFDGRIKANAAIVSPGTGGAVSVYVTNTADLVLDINGYFVPASSASLAFYPLPPCRVLDTRPGGTFSGQRTINVLSSSCGIPDTAQAYSLNFAVVPQFGLPMWIFNAWQAGLSQPHTSVLNAPTGTIVANAAIVSPDSSGNIDVWASNSTDLVIDTNGYFAPPASGGLALYSLSPCRVLDTRLGGGLFSGELTIDVLGSGCSIPATAQAYIFNSTVVPEGPLGYLTLWPDGQPRPQASSVNALDGAVASNMAIVPANTTNGMIDAYASGFTQLILDASSYLAPLPGLAVTTTSLPDGATGQPYQAQLAASGGEPPYTWSVTQGSLPPGLTLSNDGVISGTPTAGGSFPFTVQVTDAVSNTASANLSISVTTGALVITTTSLPQGTVSVAYAATLGAAGGVPPYTWSIASGTLPDGLSLNAGTGLISGTPTTDGVSNFTVQVQDAQSNTAQAPLQIVINAATTNGALNGHYAFSFNGFKNGSPVFMAGSFVADGAGHITTGVFDLNTGGGDPQVGYLFSGFYTITANGLGTMSFNNGALGALNFHIAVSGGGNGALILDNSDPNTRGSGSFYVQTVSDFSVPRAGAYAYGTIGADGGFNRYAKAGALQVGGSGTVTSGTEDIDDNGTLSSRTYSGQFSAPSLTGRGQATMSFPAGVTNNYAYYIVSRGQILLVGTDPVSDIDPLTLASILVQPGGGFTNASLSGPSIYEVSAVAPNGGSPVADVVLGLVNADGNGNVTVSLDENRGGTIGQQQMQGTYSVASNGKVTFTNLGQTPPILYLANANQAFVVGQDNAVTSGILEPQSAPPPFTNLSVLGNYLGGTVTPVLSGLTDAVSFLFADGNQRNGNLNGIQDTSGPNGTGTINLSATYQVDSTGRAVVTGTPEGILYLVSPKKVVFLPTDTNPILSSFSQP